MKKRSNSKTTKGRSVSKKKVPKKVRQSVIAVGDRSEQAPVEPGSSQIPEREVVPTLDGYEGASLTRAKAQWFFGEWKALAGMDINALRRHPDRDRFALLAASAHQQLGDHDKAREYTRTALEWGCPPRVVAQILIADVHNTLGRIAALNQDERRVVRHFQAAVAGTGKNEEALVSHARSVREMTHLGLLPQAASLLDKELQAVRTPQQRPEQQQARLKVLETELELLHHELSLAQQRQQLFRVDAEVTMPEPDDSEWLARLKKRSVSQLGQDLWVLERTGYMRGGFFVEFGATDGVLLSNTLLLEKEFGWNGICAEPNPKLFEQLKKNRACTVSSACIAGESGREIEFIFADAFGGMAAYADADMHADKRTAYAASGMSARLKTISLDDFLIENNAPHEIDYLSIDTEGSELEILSAFPFEKWKIKLLTVEHNFTEQRKTIRELLENHGYRCQEQQWDDWYYKS